MSTKKAGCILINCEQNKIGLVYRKDKNDISFPKGHLEEGETIKQCAAREVGEETGRKCKIIDSYKLPTLNYTSSHGEDSETYFFAAIDKGKSPKNIEEELMHEIIWKSINEVEGALSYDNLKEYWNKVKETIIQIIEKTHI